VRKEASYFLTSLCIQTAPSQVKGF